MGGGDGWVGGWVGGRLSLHDQLSHDGLCFNPHNCDILACCVTLQYAGHTSWHNCVTLQYAGHTSWHVVSLCSMPAIHPGMLCHFVVCRPYIPACCVTLQYAGHTSWHVVSLCSMPAIHPGIIVSLCSMPAIHPGMLCHFAVCRPYILACCVTL